MNEIYQFTRIITKREAINQYGKLGYRSHREAVFIQAKSMDEAEKKLAPFNYKKHIRFWFSGTCLTDYPLNEIIDLGAISEEEERYNFN